MTKIFLKKVSGKSHSAENLEQSFMLAKRFISSKNWGGGQKTISLNRKHFWKNRKIRKKNDENFFEEGLR